MAGMEGMDMSPEKVILNSIDSVDFYHMWCCSLRNMVQGLGHDLWLPI